MQMGCTRYEITFFCFGYAAPSLNSAPFDEPFWRSFRFFATEPWLALKRLMISKTWGRRHIVAMSKLRAILWIIDVILTIVTRFLESRA
jgi:hypothetical protein